MFLSVFDVYKIGIGPSSSHTMGPMVAAARFLDELHKLNALEGSGLASAGLRVRLHGSLAHTGIGHASDRAVILGLAGYLPTSVDPDAMDEIVASVRNAGGVRPDGHPFYSFDPNIHLVLDRKAPVAAHANGMTFEALDEHGAPVLTKDYYSIGGGFVMDEEELAAFRASKLGQEERSNIPYPFATASDMLAMTKESGLSIAEMKWANERVFRADKEIEEGLDSIWRAMDDCINRGLRQSGTLPGGLGVRRRAPALFALLSDKSVTATPNPLSGTDWLAVFAMAVNEENAAGGRVVTAPTNGAAGVVPAVLRYHQHMHGVGDYWAIRTFLLTSAAIGGIIKHNASISGAEVGCQGEVGAASAMAAAGVAALMGGSPEQIENAAEIALEHHLGMTCDPIAGLVQVPCIERNAFGAVKAMTAASLALKSNGKHLVSLDVCVETMRQTGIDMSEKYKETSLGGLAVNLPQC